MSKFHLTEDGPKVCKAVSAETCRVRSNDGSNTQHFDSRQAAVAAYDKKLEKEYGSVAQPFKRLFKAKNPNVNQKIDELSKEYEKLSERVTPIDPEEEYKDNAEVAKSALSVFNATAEDWDSVIIPSHGSVKIPKLSREEIESYVLLQEYNSYMQSALKAKGVVKFHTEDGKYDSKEVFEQGYIVGLEMGMKKIAEKLQDKKYQKIDMDDVEKRIKFHHKAVITGRAKNAQEEAKKYDEVANMVKKETEISLQKQIEKEAKNLPKGYYREGLRDFSNYDLNSKGTNIVRLPDGTIFKGNGDLERAAAIQAHIRYLEDVNLIKNS